jgi:transposase
MQVGVDTHKKTHVLVALDEQGRLLGTREIANSGAGWAEALTWAQGWAGERRWGVENSGSWGKGRAQFLLAQGEPAVCEVSPHRTAQYRRRGRTQDKTDRADAPAIARLLVAEGEQLPLVPRDDATTELRLLSDQRDNLLSERTRLINQLHSQMLQIDPCYQAASGPLTVRRGIEDCRDLILDHPTPLLQTRLLIVRQLSTQILQVEAALAEVTAVLRARVQATGTPLL